MRIDAMARIISELIASPVAKVLALREGQVLKARVLDFLNGKALLEMAGEKILAKNDVALAKGEEIIVRVKNVEGEKIVLQMVKEQETAANATVNVTPFHVQSGDKLYQGELVIREEQHAQKGREGLGNIACTVILNTENLGPVKVDLDAQGSHLHCRIFVYDDKVKALVEQNLNQLSAALSESWDKVAFSCRLGSQKETTGSYPGEPKVSLFDLKV